MPELRSILPSCRCAQIPWKFDKFSTKKTYWRTRPKDCNVKMGKLDPPQARVRHPIPISFKNRPNPAMLSFKPQQIPPAHTPRKKHELLPFIAPLSGRYAQKMSPDRWDKLGWNGWGGNNRFAAMPAKPVRCIVRPTTITTMRPGPHRSSPLRPRLVLPRHPRNASNLRQKQIPQPQHQRHTRYQQQRPGKNNPIRRLGRQIHRIMKRCPIQQPTWNRRHPRDQQHPMRHRPGLSTLLDQRCRQINIMRIRFHRANQIANSIKNSRSCGSATPATDHQNSSRAREHKYSNYARHRR